MRRELCLAAPAEAGNPAEPPAEGRAPERRAPVDCPLTKGKQRQISQTAETRQAEGGRVLRPTFSLFCPPGNDVC